MNKEKVVLAYSGGLDTSVVIKWLMVNKNVDVIAVVADVGQETEDLDFIRKKALDIGAIESYALDLKQEFAEEFLSLGIMSNAMYENKYPLLSALSRPLIAQHLVEFAHKHEAKYIAHGCTGKGNDQVRFEVAITALDPDLTIIAPVREWELTNRDLEIEWAQEHGIPVVATHESPYSIDDNLWGRAIECGVLENPWTEPPSDAFKMTVDAQDAPDEAQYVTLAFKKGLPVAIDGSPLDLFDVIEQMNEISGSHGFGRIDMLENRLVGVKSREVYEVPAALSIIMAHKALEDLCLERELLHFKLGVEQQWATTIYNGLWFSPLKQALDAFIASTQQAVTGEVKLKFYKGNCTVVGRKSALSLYDHALATYDENDEFNHDAAKGFIDLHGLPTRVWAKQCAKLKDTEEGQDELDAPSPGSAQRASTTELYATVSVAELMNSISMVSKVEHAHKADVAS